MKFFGVNSQYSSCKIVYGILIIKRLSNETKFSFERIIIDEVMHNRCFYQGWCLLK